MLPAFSLLLAISVIAFPVSSMLAVGLGHSLREIARPLRQPGRVLRAVVANFVLVPLLALALSHLFSLDPPLATGLLLIGTAAGAPFLEVHHIGRLSDGGPDQPGYVAAVCPNCHRRAHAGHDAVRFNSQLSGRIRQREDALACVV